MLWAFVISPRGVRILIPCPYFHFESRTVSTETIAVGIAILVAGLVLLAFELIHPGALLLIPASILIVAGFLIVFLPDTFLTTPLGPVAVAVAAVVAGLLTIPYYRWVAPVHRPMSTTPTSLEGEIAVVVSPIVPDSLKGKVRVRSEIWSARSSVAIPAGAKVRIVGGEGVSVRVAPLESVGTAGAQR